jgi:Dolichyl-phosphate-mannose-protein mannosyltransferase
MKVETLSRARPEPRTGRASPRNSWWLDAAMLGVFSVLIRLPALLSPRELTYDDAVYGATAMAMRQGFLPYYDLFSTQGPLFLPLVFMFDLLGFRTLNGPRLLAVASGVVITLAVYSIVRRTSGRTAAIVAAAVVTISGTVLRTTGGLNADGPSTALAVTAVALALRYCDAPSLRRAGSVGAIAGGALAIKVLVVPVLFPLAVLLLWRRRIREAALAAATTVAVPLLLALPWGPFQVWRQSIWFHQSVPRERGVEFNWEALQATLWFRDRLVLGFAGLSLLVLLVAIARRFASVAAARTVPGAAPRHVLAIAFGGWAALTFAVLMLEPWQFSNHMVHLVVPLALLAALWPPPVLAVAAVTFLILPGQYDLVRPLVYSEPYGEQRAAALEALQDLPEDAWVVSDSPELVWRSGHVLPPRLIDPSYKSITAGEFTIDTVRDGVDDPRVCAALIWKTKFGYYLKGLRQALEQEGFETVQRFGEIDYLEDEQRDELQSGGYGTRQVLMVRPCPG